MTKTILMGASFLALLAAFPAFAETKVHAETSTEAKVESTMDRAGKSIERTADKAGAAIKEAYNDVKAYFDEDNKGANVNINSRLTAEELIGTTIENAKGENVGEIKDILISADGDAEMVVISDSALGLGGKMAVFDYDVIEGFNADNNAVVKLSEAQIDAAKRFEYEADKADANTTTMPANHLSLAKILDSKVYDANGKAVADIDTVAFDDDDADYIVVTFNKVLGVGGDKAALNIDALDVKPKGDNYAFTLTQSQSAEFKSAKDAAKAN